VVGIVVPDVVGLAHSVAIATLRDLGFTVQQKRETVTDPQLKNMVLSQSVGGGATAEAGDVIVLVVGRLAHGGPGKH
jgi:beta-lactam-binding protein with PASTA domain